MQMDDATTPAHAPHILIVDDYPDALDILAIYLRSMGFRVSTAVDGAEAIAAAESLAPDLIVLDLELPGVSGFEAARAIRRRPDTRDIPIIAATGYSHQRQLAMAREAGFDRIVVKPVEPDLLVDEIEDLLDAKVALVGHCDLSTVEPAHENG